MGLGNRYKGLRRCSLEAASQSTEPNAWVNEDRHRPDFEQGKSEREEIQARRHHQRRPRAAPDPNPRETSRELTARLVQLSKRVMSISDATLRIAALRENDRRTERLRDRHCGQVGSNVGGEVSGHVKLERMTLEKSLDQRKDFLPGIFQH